MAAEASRSSGSADSYIGSLISLTSKCEIRYEGVLYNINTEESSIGLRNVRSFGTEGRKKDGPQVPPSDKVYEYILFRGSDIKDLQVKSSPPVQSTQPIHNDPAIIQSHYPHPASVSTSLPSAAAGGPVTDLNSHTAQMGLPRSTFQGGLPLYQPGGSLGSWGSSGPPPSANGSGLPMPMYWQGYYGPSSGLPHVPQQSMPRPPPGLSVPPSLQQPMQYPGMNASLPTGVSNLPSLPAGAANLPEFPSPLLPPVSSSSVNLTSSLPSSTLAPSLPPAQSIALSSEATPSLISNKAPSPALPMVSLNASLPLVSPLTTTNLDINAIVPSISNKPKAAPGPTLPYQTMPQSVSSLVGTSSSSQSETSTPSLVTPGQLLQPGPTSISLSQSCQITQKDVEVVQASQSEIVAPAPTSAQAPTPAPAPVEVKAPILPLPKSDQKLNGTPQTRPTNRGRERGRGNGNSHPVTKFTEDFDFMAMNEKFKKDEVWGHLGKSSKMQSRDKEGDGKEDDGFDYQDEDEAGSSKLEVKPVYCKDDFFDSLSCNSLDRGSRNGRTKFSEQMKIDTETFGDFPRHRGGRGGRGPGRGGRGRGPYYGRGYGYYVGRGRGHTFSSRAT
ncbi:PREDICTED: protein decapping 5-like [Nelumbo nucifera]|uniref:Protein decapping 5-like n=1 Tax=Nelumbo nucifera TaxID=4432 RepID=A0A1U8ACU8_NELNU|nr:PREDICTED: protein decapping 5-like [Nelumbo nucifera]